MTKVPDLPELDALAAEDWLYVVDTDDLTDSEDGTSKKIAGSKAGGIPGNIMNFSSDPNIRLGTANASTAVQAAVSSGHAVYAPPGLYRLDETVDILDPLIMYCFGGVSVAGSGGDDDDLPLLADANPDKQAIFFTTGSNHLFRIQTGNVAIQGGVFTLAYVVPTSPASPLAPYEQACFHMPFTANGNGAGGNQNYGGWGLFIRNVWVNGAIVQLQDEDQGGIGFWFDTENYDVEGAYWTNVYLQGEASGLRYVVYAPPRRTDVYQWNNNAHFRFGVQSCKTAIHSASFNAVTTWTKHQGRHMFSSLEETTRYPSLYLRGGGHIIEQAEVFDFGKPTSNDGFETNQKYYDIHGADIEMIRHDEFMASGNSDFDNDSRTFWPYLHQAQGIFPRFLSRQASRGVFIPELHDQLLYNALRGTVTLLPYQGSDVISSPSSPPSIEAAFDALGYDSTSAGITPSTDLTISNEDTIFLYEGVIQGVGMNWNQAAIDRMDYAELRISTVNTSLADIWIAITNTDDSHPLYIQVMRYTDSSPQDLPSQTETRKIRDMPETRNKIRVHRFELDGSGGQDTIVRFIGSNATGANSPESVGYGFTIFGTEEFSRQPTPILTVHGGKRVFGELLFDQGGVGDRQVTTTELEDISHEVNTSAYKREGFCVYNTSTNRPVWANGSGDGDNWLHSDGTVAHTPV